MVVFFCYNLSLSTEIRITTKTHFRMCLWLDSVSREVLLIRKTQTECEQSDSMAWDPGLEIKMPASWAPAFTFPASRIRAALLSLPQTTNKIYILELFLVSSLATAIRKVANTNMEGKSDTCHLSRSIGKPFGTQPLIQCVLTSLFPPKTNSNLSPTTIQEYYEKLNVFPDFIFKKY